MRQAWGVKLELHNAPAGAFVDGRMIRGIQEHLFAVLRDILYVHGEVYEHGSVELRESQGITNAVYRVLRNAGVLVPRVRPDIVVCWGGHSISREEYEYTKQVGYQLGLAGLERLHRLRPGRHERPDEGRDDRSREAAHSCRAGTWGSPSPASSRPSRPMRS